MNKAGKALIELRQMDELADMESPVHSIHALIKLIVTITYIVLVVSFHKYDFTGLLIMVIYPLFLFNLSGVPIKTCFYKLRLIIPLVCMVGVFNPIFDREVLVHVGNVGISGGVISMITLMMKGVFSLMASFLLISTTKIDALCAGLRMVKCPSMLVTLTLLTYRYISVLTEEVAIMSDAYHLRAPGQKGVHYKAWGSFLGQLLLRSMDRADELYNSMQLRGFAGEFYYADRKRIGVKDIIYLIVWVGIFFFFRYVNVIGLIGNMIF